MAKVLIVTHTEVEQLLPMADCIELMAETLASLTSGEMLQPLRMVVRPTDSLGLMALMPAYRSTNNPVYGLKTICVFPGNVAEGKDAHQGGVLLFSGSTGELLALINASAITALRTAAVSAVATRVLALPAACELAIIGAGIQARSHLAAIACVRRIKKARVVSRTFEHAHRLSEEASSQYPFPVTAVPAIEEALDGADIVVTATTSHDPVLRYEWITPGAHINAVGAVGPEHIKAELGEVLIGIKPGRSSADEITLFKSLGLAVEDLAAAEYVSLQAQTRGLGTWVDF